MRRPTRSLLLAAAAILLVPLGAASSPVSPAWADTAGGTPIDNDSYHIVNAATTTGTPELLDIGDAVTTTGGPVIQWSSNGHSSQEWTIHSIGGTDEFELVDANSGLCLDQPETAAGTQLVQQSCDQSAAELWWLEPAADGTSIVNVQTGLYADTAAASTSEGSAIVADEGDGGATEQWQFTQSEAWIGAWAAGLKGQSSGLGLSGGYSFNNQTIRMVIHPSISSGLARLRLSNLYGSAPLVIGAVDIAVSAGPNRGDAVPGTHHTVTFSGFAGITIAAGADAASDPLPMNVVADQDLLVSVYLPDPVGPATFHEDSLAYTYFSKTGNYASDDSASADYPPNSARSGGWYFLDGLDVTSATATGTVVATGDSITDGVNSDMGGDDRWPDYLARELDAVPGGPDLSVVDAAIGSNEVTQNYSELPSEGMNYSLEARFQHDVLDQPGVKDVILLEGINDIIHGGATEQSLEAGYQWVVTQAHLHGIKVIGATMLPFSPDSTYTAAREQIREDVNQWILTSNVFDSVIDFNALMSYADPAGDPPMINPAYDNDGNTMHPDGNGYAHMAQYVDLSKL